MRKLIYLSILLPAIVFADAVIFSGSNVKALKPNLDLNGQSKIMSGTVDPSSSATSANKGSLYLNTSNANLYRKTDNGSSTNWLAILSGGDVVGPGSATDNAIVRFDSTTGKLIQNSTVTVGDTGNVTGIGTLSASGAVNLGSSLDGPVANFGTLSVTGPADFTAAGNIVTGGTFQAPISMSTVGVVTNDASGVLATALKLPISLGGTNSSTALTGSRVMISTTSDIREHSSVTPTELGYVASGALGPVGMGYSWITSTSTFTFPANSTASTVYRIIAQGAGGSGGAGDASHAGGGGGGGGGCAIKHFSGQVGTGTLSITIGAAATGVGSAANGSDGGNTLVKSGSVSIGTLSAYGGAGGKGGGGDRAWRGGSGGAASGGDTGMNFSGQGGGFGHIIAHGSNGNGIGGMGGDGGCFGRGSRGGWDVSGEENGDAPTGCGGGSGGGGARAGAVNGSSQTTSAGCVYIEWIR